MSKSIHKYSDDEYDDDSSLIRKNVTKSPTSTSSTSSKASILIHKDTDVLSTHSLTNEPKSPYNALTHQLRKMVPHEIACLIGCRGDKCKYCNSNWNESEMELRGLYSHWITDEMLAMARPTTRVLKEFNLIEQMKKKDIQSIFNLQFQNEHKDCGSGIESSGFSYDPEEFIRNNIFYYNFPIEDFSIASTERMIDMMKVVCFALRHGKVAVHCHAGLGRTGLFIACYLIYKYRMSANETINYIRLRRKNSVQMQDQIQAIQSFDNFISPMRIIYANDIKCRYYGLYFTLNEYVHRQRFFMHGYDARTFKHVPKILHICTNRLRTILKSTSNLSTRRSTNSLLKSTEYFDNEGYPKESQHKLRNSQSEKQIVNNSSHNMVESIFQALNSFSFSKQTMDCLYSYHSSINENSENVDEHLANESNPHVLVALIWSWLDHLKKFKKKPLLDEQEINILLNQTTRDEYGEEQFKWHELDKCTYKTIDLLLNLYRDLLVICFKKQDDTLKTLISILTQSKLQQSKKDFDHKEDTQIYYTNMLKQIYVEKLLLAIKYFIKNPLFKNNLLVIQSVDSLSDTSSLSKNNMQTHVPSRKENSKE